MGKDLKDSHLVHQKELQQFVLDAAGAGLQELAHLKGFEPLVELLLVLGYPVICNYQSWEQQNENYTHKDKGALQTCRMFKKNT